jgi:LuxR family maltose regulon positive regulatory protein
VSTEILQTKLYIPLPKPTLTPRPHLVERLNAGLSRKVIVISAPAGFGKTTLLAEFGTHIMADSVPAARRPPQLCWLSLDEFDNDPVRFWTHFIAALQKNQCELGSDALAMLQASPQALPPRQC